MTDAVYDHFRQTLVACKTQKQLFAAIVNAPFHFKIETTRLALGIVVLLLADKDDGLIHRVALSETEMAAGTRDVSVKRFEDIKIPLDYEHNIVAAAIRTGKPQRTADWAYLFAPDLTPAEARLNQAGGAIASSIVHPLRDVGDGGALIFSYYQYLENIGVEQETFMQRYSKLVADALRVRQHQPGRLTQAK